MSNPYQAWFDKLDRTVEDLGADGGIKETREDAAMLLRQAGFVLANLLNVTASTLPALILPVEGEAVDETPPDSATSVG